MQVILLYHVSSFFSITDLFFLTIAVIAQIFIPNVELAIGILAKRTSNKEAKAKI